MRVLWIAFIFLIMRTHAEEVAPSSPSNNSTKKAVRKLASTKGKVKYKKNVTMEFDGRSVDGNVVGPDSSDIEGDKNIKFDSLLEGRKNFKREFKRNSGATQ